MKVYRRVRRRERSQASRGLGVIVGAAVFLLWWAGLLRFGFSAAPEAFRAVGVEPGVEPDPDRAEGEVQRDDEAGTDDGRNEEPRPGQ